MNPVDVVVVDDDPLLLQLQTDFLQEAGIKPDCYSDPEAAWKAIQGAPPRLLVTDWEMPGLSGLELLFKTRGLERPPRVVVVTGHGSVDRAVSAMLQGASHFLEKPLDKTRYLEAVRSALDAARGLEAAPAAAGTAKPAPHDGKLIAQSPAMREAVELARAAASSEAAVLLLGESGTGKEIIAHFIHRNSPRARGPLVQVNCGALPENLVESELFGHEKGAFTGAERKRVGRFEQAAGGTLFLDEIGDLQHSLQVKLLRAIQERTIDRVGSESSIRVDFRLVTATHRDLRALVADGTFREDLYYRVNVVPIRLPPLRERPEEVEPLARHFFSLLRARLSQGPREISPEALQCLRLFPWPGNVRQLRNALEFALVMCRGERIAVRDLPPEVRQEAPQTDGALESSAPAALQAGAPPASTAPALPFHLQLASAGGLDEALKQAEAQYIRLALERHQWNIESTLLDLKIGRSRLYERMKEYEIKRPRA